MTEWLGSYVNAYGYVDEYRDMTAVKVPSKGTNAVPLHGEVRVTDPDTGGQKGEKPEAYALIPVEALAEIARVYGYGAKKYEPNNWRRGYTWSLSYSAMQRHLNAFWSGEELDPESGLPHLAHAGFHILTLLTYAAGEQYRSKDDRA